MTDRPGSESAAFLTSKELCRHPIDPASFQTPIDELLTADNKLPYEQANWLGTKTNSKVGHKAAFSSASQSGVRMERQEMPAPIVDPLKLYLRPGTQECGKLEVLHIVDFITKIVAKEEDKLLIDNGGNKLFVKSGPTKPKLESVTMNQWVIGALRILNHFFESNQISSLTEKQSYVGYMVKVMELAGCHDWVSVLHYDDEFCHMQALYNIPWLYESHHIHLTRLQPKPGCHWDSSRGKGKTASCN